MKVALLAVTLLSILGLGTRDLQAQAYNPYYTPYENGTQYLPPAHESNPYYQLEVIHYQLYLPYHQPYPIYQLYQPCCIGGAIIIPTFPTVISPWPAVIVGPRVIRRR